MGGTINQTRGTYQSGLGKGGWVEPTASQQAYQLVPSWDSASMFPPCQALDKMEKEWSTILFNVLPYKETETYILKSPDEASQLLDDHIVMTQSMSFSPYKKPFEQRINSWENKLKLTQVGLHLSSLGGLSRRQLRVHVWERYRACPGLSTLGSLSTVCQNSQQL